MRKMALASVGRRLKAAAIRADLTSGQIGERIGVSDGQIRDWWRGRGSPNPLQLRDYAMAVGVTTDSLVAEDEAAPFVPMLTGDLCPERATMERIFESMERMHEELKRRVLTG